MKYFALLLPTLLLLLAPLAGAIVIPFQPFCTHGDIFINGSILDKDRCFYYATPPGKSEVDLGLEDNCRPKNISWAEITDMTDTPTGNWSFRIFHLNNGTNGTYTEIVELQPPVTRGSLGIPNVLVQGRNTSINATWMSNCSVANFTVYLHSIFEKPAFYTGRHVGQNQTDLVWLDVGRVKGTHVFALKYDYMGETGEIESRQVEVTGSEVTIKGIRAFSNDRTSLTLKKVGDGARVTGLRIILIGNETVNRTVYNQTRLPTGNVSFELTRIVHKTTAMEYPVLFKIQRKEIELSAETEIGSEWENSFLEEGLPPGTGYLASINLTIRDDFLKKDYYVVKNLTGVVENVCGNYICGPGECETCPDDCTTEDCPVEETNETNETKTIWDGLTLGGIESLLSGAGLSVNDTEKLLADANLTVSGVRTMLIEANMTLEEAQNILAGLVTPEPEPEVAKEPELAERGPEIVLPDIPPKKKAAVALLVLLVAFAALLLKSMGKQLTHS